MVTGAAQGTFAHEDIYVYLFFLLLYEMANNHSDPSGRSVAIHDAAYQQQEVAAAEVGQGGA